MFLVPDVIKPEVKGDDDLKYFESVIQANDNLVPVQHKANDKFADFDFNVAAN